MSHCVQVCRCINDSHLSVLFTLLSPLHLPPPDSLLAASPYIQLLHKYTSCFNEGKDPVPMQNASLLPLLSQLGEVGVRRGYSFIHISYLALKMTLWITNHAGWLNCSYRQHEHHCPNRPVLTIFTVNLYCLLSGYITLIIYCIITKSCSTYCLLWWEYMTFTYVWMPEHAHICIIFEINTKQLNNEGIFQEMTWRIHMHFTKASDVPLNDFNEYWGAVEQERDNKIDSGFKKKEAFFLCSLMLSVWQWLSFVKEQCCALFQLLHDNDEKKYFSSSNDGP